LKKLDVPLRDQAMKALRKLKKSDLDELIRLMELARSED
jgi:hypothetical protein